MAGLDPAEIKAVVDAAFAPDDALTQAFVVTWKGQIIAERYGSGATAATPLEGWSMGKSIAASLMGVQMQQGLYTLDQPALIPEWQSAGDKRQSIRIRDILNMSSGLRVRAEQDLDYAYDGGHPDHWYDYTRNNAFAYAASRPQQWPPRSRLVFLKTWLRYKFMILGQFYTIFRFRKLVNGPGLGACMFAGCPLSCFQP